MGAPPDGSVQEVDWLIEARAANVPEHGKNELARLRAALESDGRLQTVELFAARTRSRIRQFLGMRETDMRTRCITRASGGGPAVLQVHSAFEEALGVAFPGQDAWRISTGCLGPLGGVRDG
jgi:hypothetical protein